MSWKSKGNCNGEPPQIFYLTDSSKAKSVCKDCPVQEECFLFAIQYNEYGVWGGYTEEERRLMKVSSIVQAVPLVETLRRNKHELEHPASVSPLRPSYRFGLRNRSQEAFEKVAALPPLIFGKACTA